jgi:hypothetical protein
MQQSLDKAGRTGMKDEDEDAGGYVERRRPHADDAI